LTVNLVSIPNRVKCLEEVYLRVPHLSVVTYLGGLVRAVLTLGCPKVHRGCKKPVRQVPRI